MAKKVMRSIFGEEMQMAQKVMRFDLMIREGNAPNN